MRKFWIQIFLFCMLFTKNQNLYCQNLDIDILKEININRNTKLDPSFKIISTTEGYLGIGIPISVCVTALARKDKLLLEKGLNMSLALAINTLGTYSLKRTINRDRPGVTYPTIQALESERHYSFPSGHTSNAFVTATSLSLNFKKWYIVVPSYVWACGVGYSRMHLGMHYPSDVVAGAVLGMGSAWVSYKANRWIKNYYYKKYNQNNKA